MLQCCADTEWIRLAQVLDMAHLASRKLSRTNWQILAWRRKKLKLQVLKITLEHFIVSRMKELRLIFHLFYQFLSPILMPDRKIFMFLIYEFFYMNVYSYRQNVGAGISTAVLGLSVFCRNWEGTRVAREWANQARLVKAPSCAKIR